MKTIRTTCTPLKALKNCNNSRRKFKFVDIPISGGMPALCAVPTLAHLAVRNLLDLVLDRFVALAQGRTEDWSRVLYDTLARHANPSLYAELFEHMLLRLDGLFAEQPELRPRVRNIASDETGSAETRCKYFK